MIAIKRQSLQILRSELGASLGRFVFLLKCDVVDSLNLMALLRHCQHADMDMRSTLRVTTMQALVVSRHKVSVVSKEALS